MRRLLSILTISIGTLVSTHGSGQTVSQVYGDNLTKQTQTVFVTAEVDWTTYDSEAVDSNTTSSTTAFSVGGYAGEDRVLGVFADSVQQNMDFDLNDANIKNRWTDMRVQARFWFFYPSVGATLTETKIIDADGGRLADLYGTGINYGLGAKFPLTRGMMIEADAKVTQITDSNDRSDNGAELVGRQEGRVQASFDIVKNYVDFLVGYKMRRFQLNTEEEEFLEAQSAPFTGLRLGAYF